MSSIAEHLAMAEFYRANRHTAELGYRSAIANTGQQHGWMFLEVHLDEMIAERSAEEMAAARADAERVARENMPPETAEELIRVYREVLAGKRLIDGYKQPPARGIDSPEGVETRSGSTAKLQEPGRDSDAPKSISASPKEPT